MLNQHVCFIGAGSMAEAMIAGLLEKQLSTGDTIHVINKANVARLRGLQERFNVQCPEKKEAAVEQADIVVLAVRPQDVQEAMGLWARRLKPGQHLLVSVAAGIPTAHLETYVQEGVAVIRAMPNTSSTIGKSATGIAPGRWAETRHLQLMEKLFSAIGSVVTLEEELLNVVTGLSGSGPAYVYYLVEALEQAGITSGLQPDIARQLTVQTLLGAAEMLIQTGEEPSVLRRKITSPGGTTFAGLEVLKSRGFSETVQEAVFSARDRAKELGEEWSAAVVK